MASAVALQPPDPDGKTQDKQGKYGIFELSSPSRGKDHTNDIFSCNHQGDIVAVHGLNGHPLRTWTHSNGKCWLKDFLPKSLPRSRIFTYGYPSEVPLSLSWADVDDFARGLLSDLNSIRSNSTVSDGGEPS